MNKNLKYHINNKNTKPKTKMATSDKIDLKERYILEEQDSKENFFNTLVKNSETYMVMKLNDHINQYGLNLPAETEKDLNSFLGNRSFSSQEKKKVEFKTLLLKISNAKNDEERKNHVEEFRKNFFSGCLDYYRPSNVKESNNLKTVGEVDIGSVLTDQVLNKGDFEYTKKQFFEGTCEKQITLFRKSVIHLLDLERLLDKNAFCFEYVLNILNSYGHEPNLAKYLKRYIKEKKQFNNSATIPEEWYNKMTLSELEKFRVEYPEITSDKQYIKSHFIKTFELSPGTFPCDASDLKSTKTTLL